MPTKHTRIGAMVYPHTDADIERLMELTGHHKSAIIREALEVGAKVLLKRHQELSIQSTDATADI
jgi:hypothetical protein